MDAANSKRKLVITEDGSHTLFVPELNEHYHSVHGAVQESMHVFIQTGLNIIIDKKSISILEVGFGTGLNALLTLREAMEQKKDISFTSIEKYPITVEEIEILNYAAFLGIDFSDVYKQLHDATWNSYVEIQLSCSDDNNNSSFQLKKLQLDLLNFITEEKFDLIYFDAFSPNVQPELWSETVFKKMYNCLQPKGILVTYSAKGFVKRNLRAAGFLVKRLPGPPGKREMLRAIKEAIN